MAAITRQGDSIMSREETGKGWRKEGDIDKGEELYLGLCTCSTHNKERCCD